MDHAVYPFATVKKAFDSAFEANPDREAAIRAAAHELGINPEAVREVVETTTGTPA